MDSGGRLRPLFCFDVLVCEAVEHMNVVDWMVTCQGAVSHDLRRAFSSSSHERLKGFLPGRTCPSFKIGDRLASDLGSWFKLKMNLLIAL